MRLKIIQKFNSFGDFICLDEQGRKHFVDLRIDGGIPKEIEDSDLFGTDIEFDSLTPYIEIASGIEWPPPKDRMKIPAEHEPIPILREPVPAPIPEQILPPEPGPIEKDFRRLCSIHPHVNYKTAWGCPDCLAELREEAKRLRDELESALEEKGCIFEDNQNKSDRIRDLEGAGRDLLSLIFLVGDIDRNEGRYNTSGQVLIHSDQMREGFRAIMRAERLIELPADPIQAPISTPKSEGKIYYCTVCHENAVDAEAGFDTCPDCLKRM